jgi:hypothetical protein
VLDVLKEEVCAANQELPRWGRVTLTCGNTNAGSRGAIERGSQATGS